MLFLVSTSIIALTFNIVIISLWILLWVIAKHYSTNTKGTPFLIFFIGLYLFYPTSATAFHIIHWRELVFSWILLVFVVLYRPPISKYLKGYNTVKMIFYGWIIWGVLVYSCILYVNYIYELIFNTPYKESPFSLITLTRDSTMFTRVIPMLIAPLIMLIPLFALRNVKDFELFWVALTKLTLVLLILSLIRYIFLIEYIPQDYVDIRFYGFRMGGFSVVNPGDFSRLLLLPLLFISSLAIVYPSKIKLYGWITLFLIILCIILTFSRTTYISSLSGLIVLLLFHIKKAKKTITFIILISVFVGTAFYFLNVETYFEPGSERASMGSFESRIIRYAAAYEIISSNPFFGAFPGGHEISKSKLGFSGLGYGSAHNMFLNVAVEWGLPMGILLLLALFLAFWNGIQTIKTMRDNQNIKNQIWLKTTAYGTIALAFAYLFEGLTVNIPPNFVFFILGLSIATRRLLSFQ